jgi:multidrug efflux pump subunit AcrA (membrane-fusion protein)
LPKVERGQTVQVRSTSIPDRVFPATIEVVADALDPISRTIKVRAAVPNPDRRLKSEMLVSIEARSSTAHAVEVPSRAVFALGDRHYAYAMVSTQAFERREVQVGSCLGASVQVLRGLRCGERVVADGALLLEQIWAHRASALPENAPNGSTAKAAGSSLEMVAAESSATEE